MFQRLVWLFWACLCLSVSASSSSFPVSGPLHRSFVYDNVIFCGRFSFFMHLIQSLPPLLFLLLLISPLPHTLPFFWLFCSFTLLTVRRPPYRHCLCLTSFRPSPPFCSFLKALAEPWPQSTCSCFLVCVCLVKSNPHLKRSHLSLFFFVCVYVCSFPSVVLSVISRVRGVTSLEFEQFFFFYCLCRAFLVTSPELSVH